MENKEKKCNKKYLLFLLLLLLPLISLTKLKLGNSNKKKTTECEAGTYLDYWTSNCLPCSIGYYSTEGSNYCSRCPYGQSSYASS